MLYNMQYRKVVTIDGTCATGFGGTKCSLTETNMHMELTQISLNSGNSKIKMVLVLLVVLMQVSKASLKA